jgi:hypothetical protein
MRRFLRKAVNLTGVATVMVATLIGVLAMAAPRSTIGDAMGVDTTEARTDTTSHRGLVRLLGLSGRLRVVDMAPLATLVPALAAAPPGLHPTGLSAPDGEPIQALSLVPLHAKLGPSWRGYRVGFWPGERAQNRSRARYTLPAGFLEVTPENQDLPLSTHFRVRDFLTHDQQNTWPKVLVIQLPLLDKLELIAEALQALGKPPALRVMSGFRTPQYNALGVGPRGGRARDSRHMYGDAADIFVDADGDGRMDDLDGDGRVTVKDARWLARVAAEVEAEHPPVTGGIGIYHATAVHGPFVHVDTRGTPARW